MQTVNPRLVLQTFLFSLAAILSTSSMAVEFEPFTQERFEALQEQGEKILIDISASWCPDCQKQQVVLTEYQEQYPDSNIHILKVDFDDQKEWVTHFRAPRQSTLILFSGEERVWFSVAETRQQQIFEALNSI
ncbi:MAG: thioredoxin family protein [Pseudohongiellaceae bacterium]